MTYGFLVGEFAVVRSHPASELKQFDFSGIYVFGSDNMKSRNNAAATRAYAKKPVPTKACFSDVPMEAASVSQRQASVARTIT